MKWVWEHKNWPNFEYDISKIMPYELEFVKNSGIAFGSIQHFEESSLEQLKIEILTQEALSTSSIEGEILRRDSVQSSIRRHLGLKSERRKVEASEAGISELMVDAYLKYDAPLSKKLLCEWHKMVTNGRRDLDVIGNYRKHPEPMQIVSGNYSNQKIFYEAPPSKNVQKEMDKLIKWYNHYLDKNMEVPTLVFAGILHIHFEMIHPFEDGNGRIGRALVEKSISHRMGFPSLNSFSKVLELKKKKYYDALQKTNHKLDLTEWLIYFSKTILEAQNYTSKLIVFLINKTKFFAKYNDVLNDRQEKIVTRVFEEGLKGFKGGLSASNYKSITGASPATATRDLQELVSINAFSKTGDLKNSRYFINLEDL